MNGEIQIKVSPEMRELVDRLEKVDIGALLRQRDELLKRIDQYETMLDTVRDKMERLEIERDELRTALNDAIHSPMGVVPVSAHPFYDWKAGKVKQ